MDTAWLILIHARLRSARPRRRRNAQRGGKPWQAGQAKHCKGVATDLAAAAKKERALAAEHHKIAAETGK
jgi:hypothetical protein